MPNVLHKAWLGPSCPSLAEAVSLVVALLFLEPDTLYYSRRCVVVQPPIEDLRNKAAPPLVPPLAIETYI